MPKFTPATFGEGAFNCPYCGVYARHSWHWIAEEESPSNNQPNTTSPQPTDFFSFGSLVLRGTRLDGLNASNCGHCHKPALWLGDRLLLPPNSNAEPAHEDMPASVQAIYAEAAEIVDASPRGAAALLRVALEELTHELGCDPRRRITDKIGELVGKGLSPEVIMALDIVRVTGNNASHPSGMLLLDDNRETAAALFQIINFIVEQAISHKKRLQEMHDHLPEGIRQQIEQRNRKALPEA